MRISISLRAEVPIEVYTTNKGAALAYGGTEYNLMESDRFGRVISQATVTFNIPKESVIIVYPSHEGGTVSLWESVQW